jgi:hypothetical protein
MGLLGMGERHFEADGGRWERMKKVEGDGVCRGVGDGRGSVMGFAEGLVGGVRGHVITA